SLVMAAAAWWIDSVLRATLSGDTLVLRAVRVGLTIGAALVVLGASAWLLRIGQPRIAAARLSARLIGETPRVRAQSSRATDDLRRRPRTPLRWPGAPLSFVDGDLVRPRPDHAGGQADHHRQRRDVPRDARGAGADGGMAGTVAGRRLRPRLPLAAV